MRLTKNFTLEEMTATRVPLDNTPSPKIIAALKSTAENLENIRSFLGDLQIHVNSGYRTEAVNRIVRGSPTSSHMDGEACDFICPDYGDPRAICEALKKSGYLDYVDQLIQEGIVGQSNGWVHVGYRKPYRHQFFIKPLKATGAANA